MKRLSLALIVSIAVFGLACGKKGDSAATNALPKSALPDSYLLAGAPAGATPVLAMRANAKAGDDVVVQGRAKDFVDGRAAFTMFDPSHPACNEGSRMPDCETPWDLCCDDPREVANLSTTVEFRDANGVLKTGVQGFHGLDHLDDVFVAGKLEKDGAGNLTVVAKNFYFAKHPKQ